MRKRTQVSKLGTSHSPGWHTMSFAIDGKKYTYGCSDAWYMDTMEEIARHNPFRAINCLKDAVAKKYAELVT
jgi:hypothetical protein